MVLVNYNNGTWANTAAKYTEGWTEGDSLDTATVISNWNSSSNVPGPDPGLDGYSVSNISGELSSDVTVFMKAGSNAEEPITLTLDGPVATGSFTPTYTDTYTAYREAPSPPPPSITQQPQNATVQSLHFAVVA